MLLKKLLLSVSGDEKLNIKRNTDKSWNKIYLILNDIVLYLKRYCAISYYIYYVHIELFHYLFCY